MMQGDDGFRRASRRLESNATAYDERISRLEEAEFLSALFLLGYAPVPNQRRDFALQRGNYGNLRHNPSPETRQRHDAELRLPRQCSIPTRAPLSLTKRTSSCGPSLRHQSSPAALSRANARSPFHPQHP